MDPFCHAYQSAKLRCHAEYKELFQEAVKSLEALGGHQEDIDFSAFASTAKLLYESAFVAERYSGIRGFLDKNQVKCVTC